MKLVKTFTILHLASKETASKQDMVTNVSVIQVLQVKTVMKILMIAEPCHVV